MKITKKSLGFISAFLAIIIFVPFFVNLADYAKPYIENFEKQTNRKIIAESIKIQILPTPRVVINKLSVSNIEGYTKKNLFEIKSASALLSLKNLIFGKIVIDKVVFNKPLINLEKNLQEIPNWNIEFEIEENKKNNSLVKEKKTGTNFAFAGFLVKKLQVKNATVNYIDKKSNSDQTLKNIEFELSSESVLGPYKIDGNLSINSSLVSLRGLIGPVKKSLSDIILNLVFSYENLTIESELKGIFDLEKLHLTSDLKFLVKGLPSELNFSSKKIKLSSNQAIINSKVEANSEKILINDLHLNNDPFVINGNFEYEFSLSKLICDINLLFNKDKFHLNLSNSEKNILNYKLSSESYQEILNCIGGGDLRINQPMQIKGSFEKKGDLFHFYNTELKLGKALANADFVFSNITNQINAKFIFQNFESFSKIINQPIPFYGVVSAEIDFSPIKSGNLLKFYLTTNGGKLNFEGIVADKKTIAKGKIVSKDLSINGYLLNLDGSIDALSKKIELDFSKLHLKNKGGFEFLSSAKFNIDLNEKKPIISGSISAHPLKLTSAYDGDNPKILRTVLHDNFNFYLERIANNLSDRWSKEIISPNLDCCSVDLDINVSKITIAEITLDNLQSKIKLHNSKLSIPFSAKIYNGSLTGSLDLSNENLMRTSLQVKFNNVLISLISAAKSHFSKGIANGSVAVKSFGKSCYELVQNMSGNAEFKINDGIIKGFDLKQLVGILKKPINLINKNVFEQTFSGAGETSFSSVSSSFSIKNGVASTSNLSVIAQEVTLKAEGDIDILNWYLSIKGFVNILEMKSLPPIGFKIKGAIDHPSYHLDTKDLKKMFLKSGSEIVKSIIPGIDKLIPSSKSQASASSPSEPSKPSKPDKIVKNIMKGIFG